MHFSRRQRGSGALVAAPRGARPGAAVQPTAAPTHSLPRGARGRERGPVPAPARALSGRHPAREPGLGLGPLVALLLLLLPGAPRRVGRGRGGPRGGGVGRRGRGARRRLAVGAELDGQVAHPGVFSKVTLRLELVAQRARKVPDVFS
jgi:hypothetical protein